MYRVVQCTGWYSVQDGTKGVVLRAWYSVQWVTQTHEQRHWEVASVLVLN